MRIAIAQAGLGAGGAERVIHVVAHHRQKLGDDVHVLAHSYCPKGSYYPYDEGIAVHTMSASDSRDKGVRRIVNRTRWLRQRFNAIKPDVILSFLTKTNVQSLIAGTGLAIPVIVSERNNPRMQKAHRLWEPAIHLLGRRAQQFVMQTEAARNTLPVHLRSKSIVIPNPRPDVQRRELADNQGVRIVGVGRLDYQKGFDLLLPAFAIAVSRVPELTLTIFGEGPERSALEEQVNALGIYDRVSMPGVSSKPMGWIEAADIFVLSSRFEGFCNVLVEAMAAGIPAISFDCPWGPSEIIGGPQHGRLVPPEDVEGLAVAMVELAQSEDLRRQFSIAGPQTVEQYALHKVLDEWDAVIGAACQRS